MVMLLMLMTMPVMIFVLLMLRVMITLVMSMLMTVMMLILLMLMITLLMVIIINVDGCNDVVIVDVELRNKSEFSLKCLLFPQAHLVVVGSQWVKQNSLKLFRNPIERKKMFFEVNLLK